MTRRAPLLSLLLLACAPKAQVDSVQALIDKIDWDLTPVLASPNSGTYGAAPGRSRDPVVSVLTHDMKFDRSLEAAAGGLALNAVEGVGGIQRWELREAAWRGGWPYPVLDARGWSAVANEPPPDDTFQWLSTTAEGDSMALVRARGGMGDGWVGLRGHPEVDLGLLPRGAALGTPLALPAIAGATWRVSDGGGVLYEGTLDRPETLLLASAGEWVVQILREGRELARFPIYVEIDPPEIPLLRSPRDAPLIGSTEDADRWTRDLLKHVRQSYRLPVWESNPLLEAAVKTMAQDPTRPVGEILGALGYARGAVVWTCDDVTVENCLDRWVWDPRKRGALLSTELDAMGLRTVLDARGVHLTLVLGDS